MMVLAIGFLVLLLVLTSGKQTPTESRRRQGRHTLKRPPLGEPPDVTLFVIEQYRRPVKGQPWIGPIRGEWVELVTPREDGQTVRKHSRGMTDFLSVELRRESGVYTATVTVVCRVPGIAQVEATKELDLGALLTFPQLVMIEEGDQFQVQLLIDDASQESPPEGPEDPSAWRLDDPSVKHGVYIEDQDGNTVEFEGNITGRHAWNIYDNGNCVKSYSGNIDPYTKSWSRLPKLDPPGEGQKPMLILWNTAGSEITRHEAERPFRFPRVHEKP